MSVRVTCADAAHVAVGCSSGLVVVYDVASSLFVARLAGHKGAVEAACFAEEEALLVTGAQDALVMLWARSDWSPVHTFSGHLGPVSALAVKGASLASGSRGKVVAVWDLGARKRVFAMRGHEKGVNALSAHFRLASLPEVGDVVLSASSDHSIRAFPLCFAWRTGRRHAVPFYRDSFITTLLTFSID